MNVLFWILFAYCLCERLGELILSARNQQRMRSQHFSEREHPGALNVMIAVHATWYVAMALEATLTDRELPYPLLIFAALLFLGAQALRVWTLRTLGSFWNISVLTSNENAPRFVAAGPYQYIRHPNYLAVILEIASLPLIGGAPWTAGIFSVFNGMVLWRRIRVEESHLEKIPGYLETFKDKARFLPRFHTPRASS